MLQFAMYCGTPASAARTVSEFGDRVAGTAGATGAAAAATVASEISMRRIVSIPYLRVRDRMRARFEPKSPEGTIVAECCHPKGKFILRGSETRAGASARTFPRPLTGSFERFTAAG